LGERGFRLLQILLVIADSYETQAKKEEEEQPKGRSRNGVDRRGNVYEIISPLGLKALLQLGSVAV